MCERWALYKSHLLLLLLLLLFLLLLLLLLFSQMQKLTKSILQQILLTFILVATNISGRKIVYFCILQLFQFEATDRSCKTANSVNVSQLQKYRGRYVATMFAFGRCQTASCVVVVTKVKSSLARRTLISSCKPVFAAPKWHSAERQNIAVAALKTVETAASDDTQGQSLSW